MDCYLIDCHMGRSVFVAFKKVSILKICYVVVPGLHTGGALNVARKKKACREASGQQAFTPKFVSGSCFIENKGKGWGKDMSP